MTTTMTAPRPSCQRAWNWPMMGCVWICRERQKFFEPSQTTFPLDMKQPLRRDLLAQPLAFVIRRFARGWLWVVLLVAGLWEPSLNAQHGGAVIGPATLPVSGVHAGELLLGELNCAACHQAADPIKMRLMSRQSPRLGEGGLRVTP